MLSSIRAAIILLFRVTFTAAFELHCGLGRRNRVRCSQGCCFSFERIGFGCVFVQRIGFGCVFCFEGSELPLQLNSVFARGDEIGKCGGVRIHCLHVGSMLRITSLLRSLQLCFQGYFHLLRNSLVS